MAPTPEYKPAYEPPRYYQAPYRPYNRFSSSFRTGQSEWSKMQSRVDLKPHLAQTPYSAYPTPNKSFSPPPDHFTSLAVVRQRQHKALPPIHMPPYEIKTEGSRPALHRSFSETCGFRVPPTTHRSALTDRKTEADFNNRYTELSGKLAYRYPDPGPEKQRHGNVGGSWRHVKEVLGYSGTRVVYIEGMVKLLDTDDHERHSERQLPRREQVRTPLYSATRHDVTGYQNDLKQQAERQTYKPWMDPQHFTAPQMLNRGGEIQPSSTTGKYKGFYKLQ